MVVWGILLDGPTGLTLSSQALLLIILIADVCTLWLFQPLFSSHSRSSSDASCSSHCHFDCDRTEI